MERKNTENKLKYISIAIVVIAVILISSSIVLVRFQKEQKIGVIKITGEVTDFRYADLAEKAKEDSSIEAVVLRINSPGGAVTGCFQAESSISRLREEKPVVANIEEYGASGAYLIASASDYIYARDQTTTGALGVLSIWVSYEKYYENKGIEYFIWKSGKQKDSYAPWKSPSEEENEKIKEMVENLADQLFLRIEKNRPQIEPYVETLSDGSVVYGSEAVKLEMIDNIGNYQDALKKAAEIANLDDYKPVNLTNYYSSN